MRKISEEQLARDRELGIPQSFRYSCKEYRKIEQKQRIENYNKNNPIPENIKNRIRTMNEEGFSGKSTDDYLDALERFSEDD